MRKSTTFVLSSWTQTVWMPYRYTHTHTHTHTLSLFLFLSLSLLLSHIRPSCPLLSFSLGSLNFVIRNTPTFYLIVEGRTKLKASSYEHQKSVTFVYLLIHCFILPLLHHVLFVLSSIFHISATSNNEIEDVACFITRSDQRKIVFKLWWLVSISAFYVTICKQ